MSIQHLLFHSQDLDDLRHKCLHQLAPAFEAYIAQVDEDIREGADGGERVEVEEAHLRNALYASFAYLITQDRKYAEWARRVLQPTLSMERWNVPRHIIDGRKVDLISSYVCLLWVLYLDWCADQIDPIERKDIIQALTIFGAEALISDHENQKGWYDESGPINNWVAVTNGNIGLCALYLHQEYPIWSKVLPLTIHHSQRYIDWVETDGSTEEAGGYWLYGMLNCTMFLEAARINKDQLSPDIAATGIGNWLENNNKFKQTSMFTISGLYDSQFILAFGDTGEMAQAKFADCFSLFAARFNDPMIQSFIDPNLLSTPYSFLWYNPDLKPATSSAKLWFKHFDIDWFVVRDSLISNKGFFFAFRGGSNEQTHSHFDLGNFILWYNGVPLITELGVYQKYTPDYFDNRESYYHANTQGHNCVIVNGQSQLEKGWVSEITDVSNDEITVSFTCSMQSAQFRSHKRSFVISLDGKPLIKMTDEIVTDEPADIELLFHYDAQAELSDNSVRIDAGQAKASFDFQTESSMTLELVQHEQLPYVCVHAESDSEKQRIVTRIECQLLEN